MIPWIQSHQRGCRLLLHIQPRASRTKIVGEHDGRLKLQLAAPPVDGKANQALIKFLAKKLGVAKTDIAIVQGESSRKKTLEIQGVTPEGVQRLLQG